jgi:hypothetical protein
MSTPDGTSEAPEGAYSVEEDDQLQSADTLIDRGVDDVLDEGYSPPDRPSRNHVGTTPRERYDGESLDQLLSEEEPDPAMQIDDGSADFELDTERETESGWEDEVGDLRAGRLTMVRDEDDDEDLLARDVGIDGGAASAEEAAVHVINYGE